MTTKVVNKLLNLGLLALIVLSTVSCDKEIEGVGLNLVDNNTFSTDAVVKEVTTASVNIDNVPASNIGQYLLGVYKDAEFGTLKASIAAQLSAPAVGATYLTGYGTNTVIDSVLIQIPYQATADGKYTDGKPKYKLDSVFGDASKEFKLSVYELKTFLNIVDYNDPSKTAVYNSNKVFQKGTEVFYSGNFKVNSSDTVAYIKRYAADGKTIFKRDTIMLTDKKPFISLPLDEDLIKQYFVTNASGDGFSTLDNFTRYFRGLYFETSEVGNTGGHLVSLAMTNAKMIIFYSKDVDETTDQDLDGDDIKGEKNVRVASKYEFNFNTIKSSVYERDYTVSKQSGLDRLYIQGAAGSIATTTIDLTEYKDKDWLITDASLTYYIDRSAASSIVPEKLIIYNYTDNEHIIDGLYSNTKGDLVRDTNGNPEKYIFKITDFVSEKLKSGENLSNIQLAIKVSNNGSFAESITTADVSIKNSSWTPKGVVLYNHNSSLADKRVKLTISYTKLNN
ncbi:MAG: DUF4270 domain-containing protein [Lutibacter sp.]|nr:DUF4270 domain-containing protein [Lutibacter sp.]MBP9600011.1 DUF4270 domain-containing protein [Lutibacter sp.]